MQEVSGAVKLKSTRRSLDEPRSTSVRKRSARSCLTSSFTLLQRHKRNNVELPLEEKRVGESISVFEINFSGFVEKLEGPKMAFALCVTERSRTSSRRSLDDSRELDSVRKLYEITNARARPRQRTTNQGAHELFHANVIDTDLVRQLDLFVDLRMK